MVFILLLAGCCEPEVSREAPNIVPQAWSAGLPPYGGTASFFWSASLVSPKIPGGGGMPSEVGEAVGTDKTRAEQVDFHNNYQVWAPKKLWDHHHRACWICNYQAASWQTGSCILIQKKLPVSNPTDADFMFELQDSIQWYWQHLKDSMCTKKTTFQWYMKRLLWLQSESITIL